jgi:hypothetical protein
LPHILRSQTLATLHRWHFDRARQKLKFSASVSALISLDLLLVESEKAFYDFSTVGATLDFLKGRHVLVGIFVAVFKAPTVVFGE